MMWFPVLLCLVASTFALPTLEMPAPPETIVLFTSESDLNMNLPSDYPEDIIKEQITGKNEQKDRTTNVLVSKPEESITSKTEKDKDWTIEEDVKTIIVLPSLPTPPQLPLLDESIVNSLLRAEKSEILENGSEDVRPFIVKWKLPKIRYPGSFLTDKMYGPQLTLRF